MADTKTPGVGERQTPVFKTCAIPAFKCNLAGDYLLSIQGGLPAHDAINMASLFLDSVIGLLDGVDDEDRSHVIEASIYLATLAKKSIDAVEVFHG